MSKKPRPSAKLPFYRDGIRFECQGSGRCCMSRGAYGYVYLTPEDEERLAKHLELPLQSFRQLHTDVTGGYRHLVDPDKDCIFLVDARCSVYESRPHQCRTWPFWPENMTSLRVWKREVARFCAGVGKGRVYSAEEIDQVLATQPPVE